MLKENRKVEENNFYSHPSTQELTAANRRNDDFWSGDEIDPDSRRTIQSIYTLYTVKQQSETISKARSDIETRKAVEREWIDIMQDPVEATREMKKLQTLLDEVNNDAEKEFNQQKENGLLILTNNNEEPSIMDIKVRLLEERLSDRQCFFIKCAPKISVSRFDHPHFFELIKHSARDSFSTRQKVALIRNMTLEENNRTIAELTPLLRDIETESDEAVNARRAEIGIILTPREEEEFLRFRDREAQRLFKEKLSDDQQSFVLCTLCRDRSISQLRNIMMLNNVYDFDYLIPNKHENPLELEKAVKELETLYLQVKSEIDPHKESFYEEVNHLLELRLSDTQRKLIEVFRIENPLEFEIISNILNKAAKEVLIRGKNRFINQQILLKVKKENYLNTSGGSLTLDHKGNVQLSEEEPIEGITRLFFDRNITLQPVERNEEEKERNRLLTGRFFSVLNSLVDPEVMEVISPPAEQEAMRESGAPLRLERAGSILYGIRAITHSIKEYRAAHPDVDPKLVRSLGIAAYAQKLHVRATNHQESAAREESKHLWNVATHSLSTTRHALNLVGRGGMLMAGVVCPLVLQAHFSAAFLSASHVLRYAGLGVGGVVAAAEYISRPNPYDHVDGMIRAAFAGSYESFLSSFYEVHGAIIEGFLTHNPELPEDNTVHYVSQIVYSHQEGALLGAFIPLITYFNFYNSRHPYGTLGSHSYRYIMNNVLDSLTRSLELTRQALTQYQEARAVRATANAEAQKLAEHATEISMSALLAAEETAANTTATTAETRRSNAQALEQLRELVPEKVTRTIDREKFERSQPPTKLPPPWRRGI